MALSSLKPPRHRPRKGEPKEHTETKTGAWYFWGNAGDFHEWKFRTEMKLQATKDEEKRKDKERRETYMALSE